MATRFLVLVWRDRTVVLTLCSPTVLSDSTNHAAVHSCIDTAVPVKDLQDLAEKMAQTATVKCQLDGRDGAYSNKKYEALQQEFPAPGEHRLRLEGVDCGNHLCALNDTALEFYVSGADMLLSRLTNFMGIVCCNLSQT